MPNWSICKSVTNETQRIFVNLDQVVSISDNEKGSLITYAGSDDNCFVVGNKPDEIIANAGILYA